MTHAKTDNVEANAKNTTAAKAWVGLAVSSIMSGLTVGIAFAANGSPIYITLAVAVGVLTPIATALGVYVTPNKSK